jgi:hypothetical protein
MFRTAYRTVALVLLLTAPGSVARAQGKHPDFSGRWVLDTSQTPPSPMRPTSMIETISQSGDTLRLDRSAGTVQGDAVAKITLGLDGKTWKNTVDQLGVQVNMSTVCSWDGPTLVLTSTVAVSGQELQQTERWTLDAGGKTLTSEHIVDAMGQHFSTKLVLNRR